MYICDILIGSVAKKQAKYRISPNTPLIGLEVVTEGRIFGDIDK